MKTYGSKRLTLYRLIYLSVIRELKKGLCIHANTSGSDSPTDPKLGSFSRNRMPLPRTLVVAPKLFVNKRQAEKKWKLPKRSQGVKKS